MVKLYVKCVVNFNIFNLIHKLCNFTSIFLIKDVFRHSDAVAVNTQGKQITLVVVTLCKLGLSCKYHL